MKDDKLPRLLEQGNIEALVLVGFIGQIERVIALALFIPIVSATAGSVGIQSLAASLAAMNQDVPKPNMTLAVLREARDGLLLGLVSGLIAGKPGYPLEMGRHARTGDCLKHAPVSHYSSASRCFPTYSAHTGASRSSHGFRSPDHDPK